MDPNQQHDDFTKSSVVIMGAGLSGICAAIKLQEKGITDIVILEKSTGFGGTWKDNAYPGCCCDVLSNLYCYSFEQNPNWSRLYPGQVEILNYVRGVATKYNLYQYVRFSSEVKAAKWDAATQKWRVSVHVLAGKEAESCENYMIETNFLVSGVGQLNQPYWPDIPGRLNFKGKVMHSARWDWSYDMRDKRVAIIGNGATAVQIVPEVAKVASQLTIFQRTPNWVIPRMDVEVAEWKKALFRNVPFLLSKLRAIAMDLNEANFLPLVQRESAQSAGLVTLCKELIRSQLPERPDLWETLTPDYAPGCKRIIISDDYFPTLQLPNVSLETRGIQRIMEESIAVEGGDSDNDDEQLDFDLIVFATGFQTNDFLLGIDVQGVGERRLHDIWAGGASALYGVTVESLPNFGMLYGPNTNLGHNSIILMIEAQARYIATLAFKVIEAKRRGSALSVMPRTARVREWNVALQKALATSSFADPRCRSWYKNKDGLVTNNWSSTVVEYQKVLSQVDWADFEFGWGPGSSRTATLEGKTTIGRIVEESFIGTQTLARSMAVGVFAAAGWLLFKNRGRLSLLH